MRDKSGGFYVAWIVIVMILFLNIFLVGVYVALLSWRADGQYPSERNKNGNKYAKKGLEIIGL